MVDEQDKAVQASWLVEERKGHLWASSYVEDRTKARQVCACNRDHHQLTLALSIQHPLSLDSISSRPRGICRQGAWQSAPRMPDRTRRTACMHRMQRY